MTNRLAGEPIFLPDTCAEISASVNGGLSGGSSVRRPGSEDPHRRQRKFLSLKIILKRNLNRYFNNSDSQFNNCVRCSLFNIRMWKKAWRFLFQPKRLLWKHTFSRCYIQFALLFFSYFWAISSLFLWAISTYSSSLKIKTTNILG